MSDALMRDTRPRSRRVNRGSGGIKFRKAWKYKGRTEELLREILATAPRPVLHVCSGSSSLGDVLVDIDHAKADVKGDARNLPFRNVGTVLIDPPYHMPLDERARFVAGCLAAIRPGGLFILHAPWMPREKKGFVLEDVEVRKPGKGLGFPQAPILVSIYRVGKLKKSKVSRWRKAPTKEWAVRQGLKPGALDEPREYCMAAENHNAGVENDCICSACHPEGAP